VEKENRKWYTEFFLLVLGFSVFAFLYSFIGFLHPMPPVHIHEYSPSKIAIEVSGHFLFGAVASIPLLSVRLLLVTGSLAVAIDVDHILSASGFFVSGRPDHSFLFVIVACVFLYLFAKRLKLDYAGALTVAALPAVVFCAHISYDIFSALYIFPPTGSSFPLLAPFSFNDILLSGWFWFLLEVSGVVISWLVHAFTKRLEGR
jgi:hypothetical protein